jgi:hypothetical protein
MESRQHCRLFSPKGWHKSAQGNALGNEDRSLSQALKGRYNFVVAAEVVTPFQGSSTRFGLRFPGRCPGLICCGPFGANSVSLSGSKRHCLAAESSSSFVWGRAQRAPPYPLASILFNGGELRFGSRIRSRKCPRNRYLGGHSEREKPRRPAIGGDGGWYPGCRSRGARGAAHT